MSQIPVSEKKAALKEYINYAKDIALVAAANLTISLFGFITLPVLTKGLGSYLYGSWSLIFTTISLITPVALLGLTTSTIRFLAAETDLKKIREDFLSTFITIFATGLTFALILFFSSGFIATWISKDASSSYFIKIGSFLILTQSLSQIGLTFFRTFRQMSFYSSLLVLKATMEVGLTIWFILRGYGLLGLISAYLISGIIIITISFLLIVKKTSIKIPRFVNIKLYLKYGLPLVPNGIILWVIHSSDRYIINYFLGVKEVGIYSAAYSLGNLISMFLGPVSMVLFPTVARLYDENKIDETRSYFQYSMKFVMMLAIPASFGLSILALPLLKILTTGEFIAGASVVPFVAFGFVIFNYFQICIYIVHLVKKTYWSARFLITAAVLNVLLNIILIPHLGILGSAVATLLTYAILGIITTIVSFRYLSFDWEALFILKSIFASLVMVTAIKLYNPESIEQLIIATIAGSVIYFLIIIFLKGFNHKENKLLLQQFIKLRK